jgi:hypothetical protein
MVWLSNISQTIFYLFYLNQFIMKKSFFLMICLLAITSLSVCQDTKRLIQPSDVERFDEALNVFCIDTLIIENNHLTNGILSKDTIKVRMFIGIHQVDSLSGNFSDENTDDYYFIYIWDAVKKHGSPIVIEKKKELFRTPSYKLYIHDVRSGQADFNRTFIVTSEPESSEPLSFILLAESKDDSLIYTRYLYKLKRKPSDEKKI